MIECRLCIYPHLIGDISLRNYSHLVVCDSCKKKHAKELFFKKAIIKGDDECWEWIAGGRGMGYGAVKFKGKVVDAHRVSWILNIGEIKNGLFVCHRCDNRKCVNPKHLFLGTHSDNMIDAVQKGRLTPPISTNFKRGHSPSNCTITKDIAIGIYKYLISNPENSISDVAKKFNVKNQLVKDISAKRVYGLKDYAVLQEVA